LMLIQTNFFRDTMTKNRTHTNRFKRKQPEQLSIPEIETEFTRRRIATAQKYCARIIAYCDKSIERNK